MIHMVDVIATSDHKWKGGHHTLLLIVAHGMLSSGSNAGWCWYNQRELARRTKQPHNTTKRYLHDLCKEPIGAPVRIEAKRDPATGRSAYRIVLAEGQDENHAPSPAARHRRKRRPTAVMEGYPSTPPVDNSDELGGGSPPTEDGERGIPVPLQGYPSTPTGYASTPEGYSSTPNGVSQYPHSPEYRIQSDHPDAEAARLRAESEPVSSEPVGSDNAHQLPLVPVVSRGADAPAREDRQETHREEPTGNDPFVIHSNRMLIALLKCNAALFESSTKQEWLTLLMRYESAIGVNIVTAVNHIIHAAGRRVAQANGLLRSPRDLDSVLFSPPAEAPHPRRRYA